MLNKKEVTNNRQWLSNFSEEIKEKSNLCAVVSDPTRIKILFLLKHNKELCVTDMAEILNMTMGAASHQLSLLEREGFITRTKMGQVVCYSLNENENEKEREVLNLLKLKVE
jgi:ArsR family transcriptional regulator